MVCVGENIRMTPTAIIEALPNTISEGEVGV
jgi:hypothetical protein